ncbi:OmpH family outer membrane protein [Thalassococcus sp. S3]|uniref:OmpH family outer membrane protein n=1 Tax=Thalassococcus sp. S3 TaxID=2017482 RepID=UPI00102415BF|nr:OmpH family outer membrane protein [Thalassococcus sp. S3]QBF31688.1 outer membrane chaperone Skp [Thalassococcus sp. S3]
MRFLTAACFVLACLCAVPSAGQAQQLGTIQSPILTVESERLFAESQFGQRVARQIEAESAVLAAENRRIESELTAEEKDLTERRPGMDAGAFRALADAFDEKVQTIRRTQDAKARVLSQRRDADRLEFLQAAAPVLEVLMREAGASVILERSSVFFSANASDITDEAIARIDQTIGDGVKDPP